jgi:hypothetical protein
MILLPKRQSSAARARGPEDRRTQASGLLFTPITDNNAMGGIGKGIAYLYSTSVQMGASSTASLFKDDWTPVSPPRAK